jgi:hypothetical protein
MASRPITRAAHAKIKAAGGEAFIFAQVADGRTLKDIAEELGVSRQILSTWANAPARRDALARARREAASALVDEALAITDSVEAETAAIQKAKLQSDLRRWIAGRLSREDWGEQQGALLNIDLGQMHLEALRAANRENAERRRVIEDE